MQGLPSVYVKVLSQVQETSCMFFPRSGESERQCMMWVTWSCSANWQQLQIQPASSGFQSVIWSVGSSRTVTRSNFILCH